MMRSNRCVVILSLLSLLCPLAVPALLLGAARADQPAPGAARADQPALGAARADQPALGAARADQPALGAARAGELASDRGSRVPSGRWREVVAVIGRAGLCTGTLVAPDVVVTAGRCVEPAPVEVLVDTVDLAGPADRIAVKWARAYPDWRSRYDIGVVMLDHIARPRPRAIAAACAVRPRLVAGAPLHVVGFGLSARSGGDGALREAAVAVVDPACASDPACRPALAPHGELIAGGQGGATCVADPGGPALLDLPGGPALAGVYSRGLAGADQPCGAGIFVRADKVASWLHAVTGAQIERVTCDGRGDDGAPSGDDGAPGGGGDELAGPGGPPGAGCASGGPATGWLALAAGAALIAGLALRPRRRRARC